MKKRIETGCLDLFTKCHELIDFIVLVLGNVPLSVPNGIGSFAELEIDF